MHLKIFHSNIASLIAKSTFWLFFSELCGRGSLFLVNVIIARHLGVSDFGVFMFALSFVSFFSIIVDFGFSSFVIKNISQERNLVDRYFFNIVFLKLLISILFFLIFLLPFIYFIDSSLFLLLSLSFVYSVFLSFITFLRAILRSLHEFRFDFWVQFLSSLFLIVCILFLIANTDKVAVFLFGYIIFSVFSFLIYFLFFIKKNLLKKLNFDFSLQKKIFKSSSFFFLSTMSVFLYYYMDVFLLYLMKGEFEVGIYSAAYRILALLIAPVAIYLNAIFPIFAMNDNSSGISKEIRMIIKSNFLYILFSSVFIFFVLYFLSDIMIIIFYGNEFLASIQILKLLLFSWLILVNYSIFVISLQSFGLEKFQLLAAFIGVIVNLSLNLLLIPKYSILGAAYSTIVTELFVGFFVVYFFIKKIWLYKGTN